MMQLRILLIAFIALLLLPQTGRAEGTIDFSHYDVPLYQQIVNRITVKIDGRLGTARSTHDRYFIIPFAYQNRGNDPAFSHSFITIIRVLADVKKPELTPELETRRYKNRKFEAFTISWLPRDFMTNPQLCVFRGSFSRLFPSQNTCPALPGRNFTLEETISLAANNELAVAMWGPYEIGKDGFELAIARKRLLDGGTILYRADDRNYRKNGTAINCFHAMAGLNKIYPDGGLFGTGFKIWGFNGTKRVLLEYIHRAERDGLHLEPIDVKKDRYGFVYASSRNGSVSYHPIQNTSAYRK
ncbi:MAG: hypothetical protein ABI016_14880 [Chthoniobacterales bacterium]